MAAITELIKEEIRVGILEQVKIIRDKDSKPHQTEEARMNLATLLDLERQFN